MAHTPPGDEAPIQQPAPVDTIAAGSTLQQAPTHREIEQRIASLEFKMWTDSLSLKDEKAVLKEISDLKKQKPKLAELDQLKGT